MKEASFILLALIVSCGLSVAGNSPSWWTGINGSTNGNPNGVWQLDKFCNSNIVPSTATPANFTRAYFTSGSTYDTTIWSGDNDWPHAFSYAGHSNASSVDELSLIFFQYTDGIDQAGWHMSLTFVAPVSGTYSISGTVDYCEIYNGAPSSAKGLDVVVFKNSGGTWSRSDSVTYYSNADTAINISSSSTHYYSGNAGLPNGIELNAGDYITFRPWAWDRGYFYQANMNGIVVSREQEWWEADNGRNVKDFGAVGDGVTDDTDAIQAAIGNGPGLIYFPSGTYLVSHEIKAWGSFGGTHLIGDYSRLRPKIVLGANTAGYDNIQNPAYVVRFYQQGPPDGEVAWDVTFDSVLDGIDIEVKSGNPGAVALSHRGNIPGYIRNCEIKLNGNYLGIDWLPGASVTENVKITGGQIGIRVGEGQAPSSLRGCTFNGQTVASVDVYQTGLVFEGCVFDGGAIGIRTPSNMGLYPAARLYLENCIFKNIIGGKAIVGSGYGSGSWWYWVLTLKNVYFNNINYIAFWESGGGNPEVTIAGQASGWCRADYVTHGNRWENGVQVNIDGENHREVTANCSVPTFTVSDYVLDIPNKSDCVNVKDYGAYGDGSHDDTVAFRAAIANKNNIFFPMGIYKVSDTITLNKDTKFIGEHSKYTTIQLVAAAEDNSFGNVDVPKPVIDTVDDANGTAVFSGFDLGKYYDASGKYNGLINIRWRVGAESIIDGIMSLNYTLAGGGSGYCPLLITGHGGGNIRHAWFPWNHCTGPGQLIITGTSGPLYFNGACTEHENSKPSVYINQSNNVTFRTLFSEDSKDILEAYSSRNLVFNNVCYNLGAASSANALTFNDCKNIEFYNYWRMWSGYYYTNAVKFSTNSVISQVADGGNACIAAYRQHSSSLEHSWNQPFAADSNTILLLHLDETTGNIATNSATAFGLGNATYINTIDENHVYSGAGILGTDLGKSVALNGSTQTIMVPDNPSLRGNIDLSGFAMELWFKPESLPVNGGSASLISKFNSNTGNTQYVLSIKEIQGSHYLNFCAGRNDGMISGDGAGITGATRIQRQQWYHVAVQYDLDEKKWQIYLNGTLEASSEIYNSWVFNNETSNLYFGSLDGSSEYFCGEIDEVRLTGGFYDFAAVPVPVHCGEPGTLYLSSDFPGTSHDCYINLRDLAEFASHWLEDNCISSDWCNGTDYDRSNYVDLQDLSRFAEQWMLCTDPAKQDCLYETLVFYIPIDNDSYVINQPGYQNTNYGSQDDLYASYNAATDVYVQASTLLSVLHDYSSEDILKADFIWYKKWNSASMFAYVYMANGAWDENSITYNNQPTSTLGQPSLSETYVVGWWYYDATFFVKQWLSGVNNYGLRIQAFSGTSSSSYHSSECVHSGTSPVGNLKPYLKVTVKSPRKIF